MRKKLILFFSHYFSLFNILASRYSFFTRAVASQKELSAEEKLVTLPFEQDYLGRQEKK
jgi:hypothetical protein